MGIFVKAIAKCDGWNGWPKGKSFQHSACIADDGKPASIDIDLEVIRHEISDVSGDNQPAVQMLVVDNLDYRFSIHGDINVQCPFCASLSTDSEKNYKATHHTDDDNDALSPFY